MRTTISISSDKYVSRKAVHFTAGVQSTENKMGGYQMVFDGAQHRALPVPGGPRCDHWYGFLIRAHRLVQLALLWEETRNHRRRRRETSKARAHLDARGHIGAALTRHRSAIASLFNLDCSSATRARSAASLASTARDSADVYGACMGRHAQTGQLRHENTQKL